MDLPLRRGLRSAILRSRERTDIRPMIGALSIGADVLAGIIIGRITVAGYTDAAEALPYGESDDPFLAQIVVGSLIAALLLVTLRLRSVPPFSVVRLLFSSVLCRCVGGLVLLAAIGLALCSPPDLVPAFGMAWLALIAGWAVGSRAALPFFVGEFARPGDARLTVATNRAGGSNRLAAKTALEADVAAAIDDLCQESSESRNPEGLSEVLDLGRPGDSDLAIIAIEQEHELDICAVPERVEDVPVRVSACRGLSGTNPISPELCLVSGIPRAVVADQPIRQWNFLVKFVLDKLGAAFLIILSAPLMLAIAVAVVWDSDGPVIFRQIRSGRDGKPFIIYKFRSMRLARAGDPSSHQTKRHDTRCTRVGRILRRSSLDELPQLWNVLRGEMSLVGPRPHADELHGCDGAGPTIVTEYAMRSRVKPGMTGWAQVNGFRGPINTEMELRKRVELDLYYIENWSISLEIRILLRTPWSVVRSQNAY